MRRTDWPEAGEEAASAVMRMRGAGDWTRDGRGGGEEIRRGVRESGVRRALNLRSESAVLPHMTQSPGCLAWSGEAWERNKMAALGAGSLQRKGWREDERRTLTTAAEVWGPRLGVKSC